MNQSIHFKSAFRALLTKQNFLFCFLISCSIASAQQTYTFTNCGATGSTGPTQAMANSSYLGTNLAGSVTIAGQGVQTWTIPNSGNYRITVAGAKGGDGKNGGSPTPPGNGAILRAELNLIGGQTMSIVCGQIGISSQTSDTGGGGGGGSFVSVNNTPLIVAGGGGSGGDNNTAATSGTTATSGLQGNNNGGAGGSGGSGGTGYGNSGGGGGFTTNGSTAAGGLSFLNGAVGGPGTYGAGGFGGGGGGNDNSQDNGAGGGGYSGGGGGGNNAAGGGGGSFIANSGINLATSNGLYNGSVVTNLGVFNTGHGYVIIEELCSISLSVAGVNPNSAICAGNSLTLTTNAVSNYSWSTGSTASSLVVSPATSTVYGLTATSPSNCVSSSQVSITVIPGLPVLSVNNPSGSICPGVTTTLTASGAFTYTWTGNVTNGAAFTPVASSIYTVTGENACGTSTAATSISIHPTPTVTATVSQPSVCSGNPVIFTASGASTYAWTGGIQNAQSYFPNVTSSYTVTGFSANGCTATAVASIIVVQTPTNIALASPPLICIGGSSTFSTSGASSYTWTWAGGNSNQQAIVITPTTAPAIVSATVSKSNANCIDTQTIQLIVNQLPFIQTIGSPTLVCADNPANLTAAGALGYTWNPGATSGQSITVFPSVTTDYTVTASDGTCVNTAIQSISVNPNPTISISSSSNVICQHDVATLTLNGATGYTWTAPPILFGSGASVVTVSPLGTTLYSVTGVNIYNCKSTMSQVINVNPTPTLNTQVNNPLVCKGGSSTISATGANSYSWNNGATTSVTVVNPAETTVYTVTGFYDNTGCNSSKTTIVSVFSPTFHVPASASACIGGTVTLTANGANSYTWNGNQPFQSIAVSPSVYTVYQVAATSSSLGPNGPVSCVSTRTVGVSIYLNPTITAMATRSTICRYEYVDLIGSGGATYTWSTLQQGSFVTVQPPPTGQETYTVLGVDSAGCKGTASVTVKIFACTGIDENSKANSFQVFPNPNQGVFKISSSGKAELEIINQLGQIVRKVNDDDYSHGQVMINGLPNGLYFIRPAGDNKIAVKKIIVNR